MIYNRVVDFKKLIQHQLKLQLYWFHCSIRTFRMAFHLQLIIFQLPDLRTMNNFMQILTLSLFFLSRNCDRNKFIWMLVVCERDHWMCKCKCVWHSFRITTIDMVLRFYWKEMIWIRLDWILIVCDSTVLIAVDSFFYLDLASYWIRIGTKIKIGISNRMKFRTKR